MLAGLGTALGHLGRKQRGIGADQRGDAFTFLPDDDAAHQQLDRGHRRRGREQGIKQFTHANNTLTQLAQAKHHANRNTIVFKVRVNTVDALPAGVQPVTVAGHHRLQCDLVALRAKKGAAKILHVGWESGIGLDILLVPGHSQSQLGRKAGGTNLRGAVRQGVHQVVLPVQRVGLGLGRQQSYKLSNLRFGQGAHPLRVKTRRRDQRKQLAAVDGLRRTGQHFAAQALGQFTDKRGARCKAKVCQQGRQVNGLHQRMPPSLQARAQFRLGLNCHDEALQARGAGLNRAFVAP